MQIQRTAVVHRLHKLIGLRSMSLTPRRDWELKHQFEVGDINPYNSEFINLIAGAPGPHLLKTCCDALKIATDHRMKFESENNAYLLQYGPPVGIEEFRVNLSKFLTTYYGSLVHPSDLIATSGATVGLHVILSSLVDMSGIIFVDDVTYMIALNSIKQYTNMTIVPVPLTETGPDMEKLEELIVKHKFEVKSPKLFWGMYYTIPIFHNPTGKLFSHDTCLALVQLARKHDLLITCDDVYNLLHYSGQPPKRLYAYDDINDTDYKGNIISNGSFSKILAPGLRLGWMECGPRCVEALRVNGFLKSGGCLNNYTSGIVASLIGLGLMDKQLKIHLDNYKKNMHAACEILQENLPQSCAFTAPGGGYFIWIELPGQINGHDFLKFSKDNYKLVAIVGDVFAIGNGFKNYLRISIAFYELDTLKKGVRILCTALNEFLSTRNL